jgi:hypothetical protein
VTSNRRHSSWWKRAFSVALAHFVAFQLVLGAAVAVQMASIAPAEATALCAEGHGGQPGDPGQGNTHHDICMACAFTAHATPLPGAVAIDHDSRSLAHAMLPDRSVASVGKSWRDSKQARGPPALA